MKEHYGKPKGKSGVADSLWAKMRALDPQISAEERNCVKRSDGGHSDACKNMKRDMVKLRAEYEKVKGGGTHNPLSPDSNDLITTRKFLGDRMGKTGEDSHTRLED